MEKILITVDGSPASNEAVEFGVELAAEQDAEVTLVHVVPPLDIIPVPAFGMGAGARPHDGQRGRPSAPRRSKSSCGAARRTRDRQSPDRRCRRRIVACADNLDVDLTVIGSRGHGTLRSALLGSVSRGVLSESRRPVAIVRGLEGVPVAAPRQVEELEPVGVRN